MFVDHIRKCDCQHDFVVVMIVDFVIGQRFISHRSGYTERCEMFVS